MNEFPHLEDEHWTPIPWGFGQAGYLDQSTAKRDVVAELHAVVAEVTGKPVEPAKRRIGFLP